LDDKDRTNGLRQKPSPYQRALPLRKIAEEAVMTTVDPLNPPRTIHAVICYIERESDGKYLLLHKAKEKFGGGFWNAPGGKIETAESAEAATLREVYEETNLKVSNLEKVGELVFFFGEMKEKPDWTAIVFKTRSFDGELVESGSEGTLQWFSPKDFPMDEMWEDDRYWLPLMFQGTKFKGIFKFTADSKRILSHELVRM
jgi:8-oxo-dGTP diphosphatase